MPTRNTPSLAQRFADREYRHAYANSFLDSRLASQVRALRRARGLSQAQLAELTGMRQSRISALERADYSAWSVSTLRRLAEAFDVGLVVRFSSFDALLHEIDRFQPDADVPAYANPDLAQGKPEVRSRARRLRRAS